MTWHRLVCVLLGHRGRIYGGPFAIMLDCERCGKQVRVRGSLDELRGLVLAILEDDHLHEHVARIRAKLNGIEGFEVDTEEAR